MSCAVMFASMQVAQADLVAAHTCIFTDVRLFKDCL